VLDVATGTADLAIQAARKDRSIRVEGVDPSEGMLGIGREKVSRAGLGKQIVLRLGDARDLPYADATFDGVCAAFGIRNVPDRERALHEMARVARPGGRIAVLELVEPGSGLLGRLARFHVRVIVPRIGALLSGSREYRYLQESIAAFPTPQKFTAMMEEAGIRDTGCRSLSFGACCLFVGCVGPTPHGNTA
jgi:demethylmenaquinone methyltransferase/2-methoxy-6-polyprenyl-1,4-benzoquinol methylase